MSGGHNREQRLRKQAELQSLYINLATLRKQEATYSSVVPELLANQINEVRQEIRRTERGLLDLDSDIINSPGRKLYWQGFEAELANDLDKAHRLYKNAARYAYPDAEAASQSVRHLTKVSAKNRQPQIWVPLPEKTSQNYFLVGVTISLLLLIILGGLWGYSRLMTIQPPQTVALETPATVTSTPVDVVLIIPDTPTPLPTNTPTFTPTVTYTPTPNNTTTSVPISIVVTDTPIPTPIPTAALKPAPKIIGPRDGLVWLAGAIVFEFESYPIAEDELYCLNGLKGYDYTKTENWSFPHVGHKRPSIAIEENVFQVAQAQEIRCIIWNASIGKHSCDNIISENTETRIIGIPGPCQDIKTKF